MVLKKINKYFSNILFNVLDNKITEEDFKYYIYGKGREADSNETHTIWSHIRSLCSILVDFLKLFDYYNERHSEEKYQKELGNYFVGLLSSYVLLFNSAQSLGISFSGQRLGAKAADGFDIFPEDGSVPVLACKILTDYSTYSLAVGGSLAYIIKEVVDNLRIEISTETKDTLNTVYDDNLKNRPFNLEVILNNFRDMLKDEGIL